MSNITARFGSIDERDGGPVMRDFEPVAQPMIPLDPTVWRSFWRSHGNSPVATVVSDLLADWADDEDNYQHTEYGRAYGMMVEVYLSPVFGLTD